MLVEKEREHLKSLRSYKNPSIPVSVESNNDVPRRDADLVAKPASPNQDGCLINRAPRSLAKIPFGYPISRSDEHDGSKYNTIAMPPRLNLYGASRSLAFRSRPSITSYRPRISPVVSRRAFADEKAPPGPNEGQLGHVSEEAGEMSKITGETGPDLGQGTPVQEVRLRLFLLGRHGFDDITPLIENVD